ncbi:MAG: spermidine/putrescine ABC transporter substrate-binding protein [Magnetococcales bacterium]|nr:spermidine/putrescine ABC transporter substrate-binding protein [Magnetococcales bacterium]
MINRRRILMGGLGLLAATLLPARAGRAEGEKRTELVILTWSDYLDPEVVKAFEARHPITVRQVHFDSDQARDQQVVRKGSDAFDIMVVNAINLASYAHQKWLTPLDKGRLANFTQLDPQWLAEAESGGRLLGLPYFWGNLGLAYREDLVHAPPTSWMDFFRPAEPLRGHLNAIATNRELVGLALKALGHSVNTEDPAHLAEAEALLIQQKPHVTSYPYIDIGKESPLITGEIKLAIVYNGDALKLREFDPRIRYVSPREGGAMWTDFLAMGTNPARREATHAFLDFLNEPAMASKNAQFLHYATPNRGALAMADPAYLADPIVFPPEEVLRKSETIRPVAPRTQRKINEIMARLQR